MIAAFHRRNAGGYSLAELLVVVAIIGVLSLVSVPAFMNYQRSLKLKTAMRKLATDFRMTRQRAITENHPTMISFKPGVNQIYYRDFDGLVQNDGTVVFAQKGIDKALDPNVYFSPSTNVCLFDDLITTPAATNGWNDVVFGANGTVTNVPALPACNTNGLLTGIVIIKTDWDVGRTTYTFEIVPTGRIRVN